MTIDVAFQHESFVANEPPVRCDTLLGLLCELINPAIALRYLFCEGLAGFTSFPSLFVGKPAA